MRRVSSKLPQLDIARNIGFNIPDSLVTNNVESFKGFLEKYRKIIFKPLVDFHYFKSDTEDNRVLYSTLIDIESFKEFDLIKNAPVFLQEYIPKEFEYRITVVGDDVYIVRVLTNSYSSDDWRKHQFSDNVKFEISNNEDFRIHELSIKMVKSLGISYGTLDIIHAKSGLDYFLEVNPNGQWYWLENSLGIPVSLSIAKTLIRIYHTNAS